MASAMEFKYFTPEQWRQFFRIELVHPDANVVSQNKLQKRLLFAIELGTDRNFCASGAFFASKRRQRVGYVGEHVEQVAFLGFDDLLHLGELFVAKALLGEALQQLLPGIGDAPQGAKLSLVLEDFREFFLHEIVLALASWHQYAPFWCRHLRFG